MRSYTICYKIDNEIDRSTSMDHADRPSTDDDVVSAFIGRKSEKGPLDLSAHAPHSIVVKKIA
jgi:hypothetical protein